MAAFKERGLCGTKPEVPAASWWAWRWGQRGVRPQKSSRGSAGEGCSPTFLRQTFPSLNLHPAFLQKTASWVWQRGCRFSLPTRERTQKWVNVDNRSAAPRERTEDTVGYSTVFCTHLPPSMKLLHSLMLALALPYQLCRKLGSLLQRKILTSHIWCVLHICLSDSSSFREPNTLNRSTWRVSSV